MEQVPATFIGLIAVIFTGFFALMRYVMINQSRVTNTFIDYIQQKNGHMERIAKDFGAKTEQHQEAMTLVAVELSKVTESNKAMVQIVNEFNKK